MRYMLIALVASVALLAGCGGDDDQSDGDEQAAVQETTTRQQAEPEQDAKPRPKPEPKEADGTVIKLASSSVGDALFDGGDQAIYLFDVEESSTPECYGDCAAAWPPVLTEGEPVAEGPVKQGLLGTTKRDDGTTQVTYNGHPLYYYAHEGPGELVCHNVAEFGGLWLALDESGDPLS